MDSRFERCVVYTEEEALVRLTCTNAIVIPISLLYVTQHILVSYSHSSSVTNGIFSPFINNAPVIIERSYRSTIFLQNKKKSCQLHEKPSSRAVYLPKTIMQYTCYFYCSMCVCLWFFFPLDNNNKNPHTESNSCPGRMCANANNSIKAVLVSITTPNLTQSPLKRNKQISKGKKKRRAVIWSE